MNEVRRDEKKEREQRERRTNYFELTFPYLRESKNNNNPEKMDLKLRKMDLKLSISILLCMLIEGGIEKVKRVAHAKDNTRTKLTVNGGQTISPQGTGLQYTQCGIH